MITEYAHKPAEARLVLRRCFTTMTTSIELAVWPRPGLDRAAERALERAEDLIHFAEQRLSRFRPDSEIGQLNQGYRGPVSRQTFEIVAAALDAARATGGLFDPTVLAALEAAGYDRTQAEVQENETARVRPSAAMLGSFRNIILHPSARTITLPPGVGLDLGGIAKGWLADRVAGQLGRYGSALADLGGDIAVGGPPPDHDGWEVEVEDPFSEAPLTLLRLTAGGVATSGTLRRRWQTTSGWQHHLIDPRTGRPAETDLLAVTVVAPSATAAEVAAKVTLLLGATAGRAALERSPGLAGLLVRNDGHVVLAGPIDAYLADTRGLYG